MSEEIVQPTKEMLVRKIFKHYGKQDKITADYYSLDEIVEVFSRFMTENKMAIVPEVVAIDYMMRGNYIKSFTIKENRYVLSPTDSSVLVLKTSPRSQTPFKYLHFDVGKIGVNEFKDNLDIRKCVISSSNRWHHANKIVAENSSCEIIPLVLKFNKKNGGMKSWN